MRSDLSNSYINKHGVYYLRISIPRCLRNRYSLRQTSFRKSLKTKQRNLAKKRSWLLISSLL